MFTAANATTPHTIFRVAFRGPSLAARPIAKRGEADSWTGATLYSLTPSRLGAASGSTR